MDHRVNRPAVIGHEMSGRIAAVGSEVAGWNVGDHVTVMPLDWCGECPACAAGNQHICHHLNFVGIDSSGAIQQRSNVRADLLVALPADLPLDVAALTEPVAVAVHDVGRDGVSAGDHVVVVGGGAIGVLIGLVAQLAGAHALTAVLKVRGVGVVVGIHSSPPPFDLFAMFWRELEIRGARVYQRPDFETAVDLLTSGRIPGKQIISRVVPADQAQTAFETLEQGGPILKVLIDCQDFAAAP